MITSFEKRNFTSHVHRTIAGKLNLRRTHIQHSSKDPSNGMYAFNTLKKKPESNAILRNKGSTINCLSHSDYHLARSLLSTAFFRNFRRQLPPAHFAWRPKVCLIRLASSVLRSDSKPLFPILVVWCSRVNKRSRICVQQRWDIEQNARLLIFRCTVCSWESGETRMDPQMAMSDFDMSATGVVDCVDLASKAL